MLLKTAQVTWPLLRRLQPLPLYKDLVKYVRRFVKDND